MMLAEHQTSLLELAVSTAVITLCQWWTARRGARKLEDTVQDRNRRLEKQDVQLEEIHGLVNGRSTAQKKQIMDQAVRLAHLTRLESDIAAAERATQEFQDCQKTETTNQKESNE